MEFLDEIGQSAASAGGAVLRGVFVVVGRLRPTDKPLHPRGRLFRARVVRHGLDQPLGAAWLDESGEDEGLVRLSRSVGLPAGLPDILGLALRVPTPGDRVGDVLFSTTGRSTLGRYVLLPRREARADYGTLLPYRCASGLSVLLGAFHRRGGGFDLAVASPTGQWRVFGELHLDGQADAESDPTLSFDPVLNPLPGLRMPDWVGRLREGAYSAARSSRRAGDPSTVSSAAGAPNR